MNYLPLANESQSVVHWQSLPGASIGLILQQAIKEANGPLLIIAPDNLTVSHLDEALRFFGNEAISVMHFPDWETLPYDHFSPHQDIISERLATLYQLPHMINGAIITTASTLLHYVPPCDYLTQHSFMLKVGDRLNLDIFKTQLITAGYHAVAQVREHGEFAVRGSIIDVFPMGSLTPFRIDLFDNEVEALRIFSTDTQRSLEKRTEIRLLPAKEFPLNQEAITFFRSAWRSHFPGNPLNCPIYQDVSEGIASAGVEYYLPLFFAKLSTLFDYLPTNTLIVTLDDIATKSNEFWHEINNRFEQTNIDYTRPLLKPETLFLSVDQLKQCIAKHHNIAIAPSTLKAAHVFPINSLPPLQINHQSPHPLSALQQFIESWSGRILFCAESIGRRELILQLFKSISLSPHPINSWEDFLTAPQRIGIAIAHFETGFCLTDPAIAVITENELYGNRVMQRRLRKKAKQQADAIVRDLAELQIGEAVVHLDHGVGYYRGLETLTVGDHVGEFLSLEYQNGDKLYVPVSSLHMISRYAGADLEHTPISKLGTEQWQKAKRHAAEKARDVAAELLELYARRSAKAGEACVLPEDQYEAFAAAFPFEETPDQLQAIQHVFNDMTSERPMDRVICGDVGFGKTEVAVRAAFLAVQNNKQVAMLVPTTLLAQQHFQTFQDRFANWPIRVDSLSRFKTAKEQRNIID